MTERTHEYVATKMKEGKAIIALCGEDFAGFTYIESWGNKQYVATSGLIVHPNSVFIFMTAAPLVRLNIFALGHRKRAKRNEAAFIRLASPKPL